MKHPVGGFQDSAVIYIYIYVYIYIHIISYFANEHPSSSIPIVMRLSYEHLGPSAIESIEFADAKAASGQ